MVNPIGNAWKYTGRRGEAVIEFGPRVIDNRRAFFVADNGVGFDMGQFPRLFRVFQRLHSSSEFEGTGVGLATVSGLFSAMVAGFGLNRAQIKGRRLLRKLTYLVKCEHAILG